MSLKKIALSLVAVIAASVFTGASAFAHHSFAMQDLATVGTRDVEGGSVNISGIWLFREQLDTFSTSEPPMQPWAEAKFKSAKPGYGPHASADSQDPIQSCLPPGMPRILLIPFPVQIIETPNEVIMLFEYDHYVRHIDMNRRDHPKNATPTWMGDSIGKWEGKTLAIDTTDLIESSWLDQVGHPHSDALHIIERVQRPDRNTLVDDITIEDPKAYTKPWTGQQVFKLRPGWHIMEYVCQDLLEGQGK
jgi:hypothetical protein